MQLRCLHRLTHAPAFPFRLSSLHSQGCEYEVLHALADSGALRRIEVWDPDRWAEVSPAGTEKLADAIERGHGLGARP